MAGNSNWKCWKLELTVKAQKIKAKNPNIEFGVQENPYIMNAPGHDGTSDQRLQCGVNSYAWGKKGSDSAAARFAAATPFSSMAIQPDQPYAELWMGTHPSNPSSDLETQRSLLDLLKDHPGLLSTSVAAKYGHQMPFLFKVLSIGTALSIQAHPNKALAEKLHARDPKNYPDGNHKPEMAIAITPFEGLCGFRPLGEIARFLETVGPLRALVGDAVAEKFIGHVHASSSLGDRGTIESQEVEKEALRTIFTALMESSDLAIEAETTKLAALVQSERSGFAGGGVGPTNGEVLSELVTRLHGQYGADIGIFVLFFLNLVKLSPGEALFLGADDVHAYLSGDIVECMAASDNVVRAGLTPKYKDISTLVSMLTYHSAPAEDQKLCPSEYPYAKLSRQAYAAGSALALYAPPPHVEEFAVVRAQLQGGAGARATFAPVDGPSVVICIQGGGSIAVGPKREAAKAGHVFFVGATAELVLEAEGEPDAEPFVLFRAFCEVPS